MGFEVQAAGGSGEPGAGRGDPDPGVATKENVRRAGEPAAGGGIELVIVDDHPAVRRGLVALLEAEPGVKVLGEADAPAEAVELAERTRPGLVVVDLVYGEGSGFDLIRALRVRVPGCRVVVYTAADGPGYPEQCLRAGAAGFVSKGEPLARLVHAVRSVAAGATYLNESRAGEVLARLVGDPSGDASPESRGPAVERLSPGEFRVFDLIGQGLSNRDVAEALHRSIKTVETYRSRIKRKLGAANATQLAQLAAASVAASGIAGGAPARAEPRPIRPARVARRRASNDAPAAPFDHGLGGVGGAPPVGGTTAAVPAAG
ncbi:MAG: two component transcriptional regulator, LuxR family [Phycisphaerales bacterium]|nr:two component transcriptional regulator, LuxR family [Phycisphaerales bacterium]